MLHGGLDRLQLCSAAKAAEVSAQGADQTKGRWPKCDGGFTDVGCAGGDGTFGLLNGIRQASVSTVSTAAAVLVHRRKRPMIVYQWSTINETKRSHPLTGVWIRHTPMTVEDFLG